jgi:hypothetical protein
VGAPIQKKGKKMSVTFIIIWATIFVGSAWFFINIGRTIERFERERLDALDAAARAIVEDQAADQADNVVSIHGGKL